MQLIIVESPTKSKTISRFLGPKYRALASYGHVRDLPKSKLGVDVENDFRPKYIIPTKSRKIITLLKKELEKAETVILACDQDREGEAIAWHLTQILDLNDKKPYQRIVFHEITKSAIEEALKNPRKIDMNLVDAQQTRRVLDRIVGYKLSPFLWKKVARGLSTGRVQSVAVRLVVEREREIENFVPQEYWTIVAQLQKCNEERARYITLVSDYGHHPTEIKVTLKAAREKYPKKKIWCVFQPHQYQRTFYLFKDFVKVFRQAPVDKLIITDIYDVAGREEKKIKKKINSEKLVKAVNKNWVIYLPKKKIINYLKKNLKGGEVVVIMGAGDIYNLVINLTEKRRRKKMN